MVGFEADSCCSGSGFNAPDNECTATAIPNAAQIFSHISCLLEKVVCMKIVLDTKRCENSVLEVS